MAWVEVPIASILLYTGIPRLGFLFFLVTNHDIYGQQQGSWTGLC